MERHPIWHELIIVFYWLAIFEIYNVIIQRYRVGYTGRILFSILILLVTSYHYICVWQKRMFQGWYKKHRVPQEVASSN